MPVLCLQSCYDEKYYKLVGGVLGIRLGAGAYDYEGPFVATET